MANNMEIKSFAELSCKSCDIDGDCSIQDSYEVNWYRVALNLPNLSKFFCAYHSELEKDE